MKIGIITQARIGSTRLPAKVLEVIGGHTVLEHHLARLARAGVPLFVATTYEAGVRGIIDVCNAAGVPYFQGETHDVLDRYAQCAATHDLDVIVRVTSDCPLVDGDLIKTALVCYHNYLGGYIFMSNCRVRTWPRGFDFEIFSRAMLDEANCQAETPHEREHVTQWMYSGKDPRINQIDIVRPGDASNHSVTLDTPEDLAHLRRLYDQGAFDLPAEGIIKLLEDNDA